jgi:hypothetical protein
LLPPSLDKRLGGRARREGWTRRQEEGGELEGTTRASVLRGERIVARLRLLVVVLLLLVVAPLAVGQGEGRGRGRQWAPVLVLVLLLRVREEEEAQLAG